MAFDIKLALIAGIDIPIPQLQFTLHQPRIKEIALIGDIDFFTGVQCLNINKNMIAQGETLLEDTHSFQIFMMIMAEKEAADKKEAVLQLFQLLFPDYHVMFTPRSLILKNDQGTIVIDENNFQYLQEIIKEMFCLNSSSNDMHNFNPKDAKAKEIADKLMRARQRVAAQTGEGEGSVFVQYVSAITVALGSMSLEDCLNLTMYQLFDLVERYSLYINWDLDIKSRLAGGKPDSKPDNWMKNIH